MSIPTVSSAADSYGATPKSLQDSRSKTLNDIANSLQVGNLAGARKALAAFLQISQGGGDPGASQGFPHAQSSTNVQALATALNSGDFTASAQSFRALRREVQNVRRASQSPLQNNGQSPDQDGSAAETSKASETGGDTLLSFLPPGHPGLTRP